jgi:hypothetical protein
MIAQETPMRIPQILVLTAAAAMAQQNTGTNVNWSAMGQGTTVHFDQGLMTLSYELRSRQFGAALLPTPAALARVRRIRFRVKSDHDTALAVLLSEKKPGGGNYTSWFWSRAGAWQQIELAPEDFSVSDSPQDPVDADGKLDLDAVEGIVVLDLAQFLMQTPRNPDFPMAVTQPTGAHTILLENLELVETAAWKKPEPIDSFDRGFLQWLTLGGVDLKLSATGNPLGKPAMQAVFQTSEGEFGVVVRRLANLDLSKATHLAFDIASGDECTLVISLEQKNGQRFTQTIYPPGARELFHVNLKLADFEGQGKLDPAQLKSLAIAQVGGEAPNTVWIADVRAGN